MSKLTDHLPPTRIKSSSVKIQEMLFGYLAAPFCAMISNAVFGSYLNRYYVDVLGWTKFGVFATLLPMLSSFVVILSADFHSHGRRGHRSDVHDTHGSIGTCADDLDCRHV